MEYLTIYDIDNILRYLDLRDLMNIQLVNKKFGLLVTNGVKKQLQYLSIFIDCAFAAIINYFHDCILCNSHLISYYMNEVIGTLTTFNRFHNHKDINMSFEYASQTYIPQGYDNQKDSDPNKYIKEIYYNLVVSKSIFARHLISDNMYIEYMPACMENFDPISQILVQINNLNWHDIYQLLLKTPNILEIMNDAILFYENKDNLLVCECVLYYKKKHKIT